MRTLSASLLIAFLYLGTIVGLLGLANLGPSPIEPIADVDRPAAVAVAHTAGLVG